MSACVQTMGYSRATPDGSSLAGDGLVRVEELSFGYGRGANVVDCVNLTLHSGRVHGLLGPSGCGKSTLLRLIAGLERPRCGRIVIGARTVVDNGHSIAPEKRPVGIVFQDYALFPHLSVQRNITFGMTSGNRSQRAAAANELLHRVGLKSLGNAMPHTLSGGQQQRVALARALARRPDVMLLDEPFSGLDAELRREVRKMTVNLLRESNVAVLMVTHDPDEARAVADEVSVMRAGAIVVTGSPSDVCDPRTSGHAAVSE